MAAETPTGTYLLLLQSEQPRETQVGALGTVRLDAGRYVYIGSAFGPGGLPARLRRHLGPAPSSPHWHIDYLRRCLTVEHVLLSTDDDRHECTWAGQIQATSWSRVPCGGAGASDCACPAHFFRIDKPDAPSVIRSLLGGTIQSFDPGELRSCLT